MLSPADRGVLEAGGFLLGHEGLDIVAQRALIAFQRENVVGFLVHHLLGDVALAAHRVDGHDRPLDRQHVQQLGDGNDFVGLFRHLHLAQHEPLTGCEGRDQMDGGLASRLRPERRDVLPSMAITPSGVPVSAATQATKQRWNCSASRTARMSPRWSCAGVPFLNGRKRRRRSSFLLPKQGDIDEGLGPGQHREQAQKQDLVERVGHLALLARVTQILEIAQENNRLVECGTIRRCIFHGCPPGKRIEGCHRFQHSIDLSPAHSPDCPGPVIASWTIPNWHARQAPS